jgi:hypothetical protein
MMEHRSALGCTGWGLHTMLWVVHGERKFSLEWTVGWIGAWTVREVTEI